MLANAPLSQAEALWPSISQFLYVPHNELEYERLSNLLNQLIDLVRDDETHPLASLIEVIGLLMESYEHLHDVERWDLE